jgi:hypothetical protein
MHYHAARAVNGGTLMTDDEKVLGKKMAKAAAIGAVIAIPVPFVGPIIGAAAGAGLAYFRSKNKA